MLSKNTFSILGKMALLMLSKKPLFRSIFSDTTFSIRVINSSNPVGKVHVFPCGDRVEKCDRKSV